MKEIIILFEKIIELYDLYEKIISIDFNNIKDVMDFILERISELKHKLDSKRYDQLVDEHYTTEKSNLDNLLSKLIDKNKRNVKLDKNKDNSKTNKKIEDIKSDKKNEDKSKQNIYI